MKHLPSDRGHESERVSFETRVIPVGQTMFQGSFRIGDLESVVGNFPTEHEAHIAVLISVQAYFKNLTSDQY